MNLHSRARSCPASRALMVRRYLEEGWTAREVGEAQGVSERTVRKWARRFLEDGAQGLLDRPSRPQGCPHQTPAALERRVVRLRQRRLTGPAIARRVGLARSTVAAILKRTGLHRLPPAEPPEPVVRYEHDHPGDLLHLDTKKLGRFRQAGHRVHGDRQRNSRGAGWEFVHLCIDDHSRLAYVEILPDEKGETAAGFLRRALAWYSAQGIRARRLLTDNGSCYLSRAFREARVEAGLKHSRTRPYRPCTNGKAERFVQTLLREWAYGKTYQTSGTRKQALPAYVRYYNHRRPHGSLQDRTPADRAGINS